MNHEPHTHTAPSLSLCVCGGGALFFSHSLQASVRLLLAPDWPLQQRERGSVMKGRGQSQSAPERRQAREERHHSSAGAAPEPGALARHVGMETTAKAGR